MAASTSRVRVADDRDESLPTTLLDVPDLATCAPSL